MLAKLMLYLGRQNDSVHAHYTGHITQGNNFAYHTMYYIKCMVMFFKWTAISYLIFLHINFVSTPLIIR